YLSTIHYRDLLSAVFGILYQLMDLMFNLGGVNTMLEWLEERLMGPLGKLARNKDLQDIGGDLVNSALPVIITGSIFLIIANPPDTLNWGIINAWVDAVEPIQGQLLFPFNLTFGLMALVVAFGVGYSLAIREDLDAVMAGMLSMLAFF